MSESRKKEYVFAFKQSVPVFLGYIFLGIAFGLMLQNAGYSYVWAFLISLCVYAGSMQFVLVTLLTGGASLLTTMIMTLFVNGRHIFYGISFIEKYKNMGKLYPYMVYSLTDETYSVLCSLKMPEGLSEKRVSFLISILDHSYWIMGSVIGALIGQFITFDSTGIDFSMTALFVVIVVNQWLEHKNHFSTIVGFCTALLALALLGPENFLLPALSLTMIILLVFRNKTEVQEDQA